MTSRNVGTAQTLVYDAVNRLTSITAPSAVNYLYDGDDQRVKESYSTSDTRYYIGSDFEYHISGTMTISRTYIRLGSELIAMRVLGDTSLNSGYFYFKTNNLGSLTGTTKNGVIVGSNVYYPYGSPLSTTSDPNNKSEFRFTGQRMDSYINLYWFGSRWYDPVIGRFIQSDSIIPDPLIPGDWDRYQYARSNPLSYIDRDGHFPILAFIALAGAFLFFSQVPSDQYQSNPANQGNPVVAGVGATLMFAPALGAAACANDGDCTNEVQAISQNVNQKSPSDATTPLGHFTNIAKDTWRSTSGLIYGPDKNFGDRANHVLQHLADNPTKTLQGVFTMTKDQVFASIDEAWAAVQAGGPNVVSTSIQGNRMIYVIDMGRIIGYIGGKIGAAQGYPTTTLLRIVIENKDEIMSAYPVGP